MIYKTKFSRISKLKGYQSRSKSNSDTCKAKSMLVSILKEVSDIIQGESRFVYLQQILEEKKHIPY